LGTFSRRREKEESVSAQDDEVFQAEFEDGAGIDGLVAKGGKEVVAVHRRGLARRGSGREAPTAMRSCTLSAPSSTGCTGMSKARSAASGVR
jgi:hypothetical protein